MSENVLFCYTCDIPFQSQQQMSQHEEGKKHKKKCLTSQAIQEKKASCYSPQGLTVSPSAFPDTTTASYGESGWCASPLTSNYFCSTCDVSLNSLEQHQSHMSGQRHQKKTKALSLTTDTSSDRCESNIHQPVEVDAEMKITENVTVKVPPPTFEYCKVCEVNILVSTKAIHESSPDHLFRSEQPINPLPEPNTLQRTCRRFLRPALPGITFTQTEADLLLAASDCTDDCVLYLPGGMDSYARVGLHLATALLTANLTGNTAPLAMWISPTANTAPHVQLFAYFNYPQQVTSHKFKSTQFYATDSQVASPPRSFNDLGNGLILTDVDYFVSHLSHWILPRKASCCYIIIQEAHLVAEHEQMCSCLKTYMALLPKTHRARVICLSDTQITTDCILKTFTAINASSFESRNRV